MKDWFDIYSLRARVLPAATFASPILAAWTVLAPTKLPPGATASTSGLALIGITALAAHAIRYRGRKLETELKKLWGGLPSTHRLRLCDPYCDKLTKTRLHNWLSWKTGTQSPSVNDEANRLQECDEIYASYCSYVRGRTRDTKAFPLLFYENMEYGFRRNLLAIKQPALTVIAICIIALLIAWSTIGLIAAGLLLMLGLAWWSVVTVDWVKDAADGYSHALIDAAETLVASEPIEQHRPLIHVP